MEYCNDSFCNIINKHIKKKGGFDPPIDMEETTIKVFDVKGPRWYCCPYCNKPLFPLREDTHIEHMPFRCKACKHDIEVTVFPTKVNNMR